MYHVNNANKVKPCRAETPEKCPFRNFGHFESESAAITAFENDISARIDHECGNQKDRVLDLNHNPDGEYENVRPEPEFFVREVKKLVEKVADGRTPADLDGPRFRTEMKSWGFGVTYSIEREYTTRGQALIISYPSIHGNRRFRFSRAEMELRYEDIKQEFSESIFNDFSGRYINEETTERKLSIAEKDTKTIFMAMEYINEAISDQRDYRQDYLFNDLVKDDGRIAGNISYYSWIDGKDMQRLLRIVPRVEGKFANINLRVCDESQKKRHTYWGLRHTHNEWFFDSFNEDGSIKSEPINSPDEAYQKVSHFIQKNQKKKGERIEKAEWARNFMIDTDEGIKKYNENMAKIMLEAEERKKEKKSREALYGKDRENGFMKKIMGLFS